MQRIGRALAVSCSLLVGIEVAAQAVFRVARGSFPWQQGPKARLAEQLFELHPYLVGWPRSEVSVTSLGKTISTTAHHTRWTGAAKGGSVITVAVLGGSTTFGAGVTDVDSWPALLQQSLGSGYAVINYGVPGYSTAESIVQLALSVPDASPRFVVFYGGWNDIQNYHQLLSPDYRAHGMRQFRNLAIPLAPRSAAEKFAEVSAAVRLVLTANRYLHRPGASVQVRSDADPNVDRLYARNLRTLRALAQHLGAHAVFIPQVLNDSMYEGRDDAHYWTPRVRNDALPGLMARFNRLMRDACPAGAGDCTYLGGVLQIDWEDADFIDEGHFSRSGGQKFASAIHAALLESIGVSD